MLSTSAFIFRFLIIVFVIILIDLYVFKGIKTATSFLGSGKSKQIIYWSYWLINISFLAAMFYGIFTFSGMHGPSSKLTVYLMGMMVLLTVPKLVFSVFLLAEDVYRILNAVFSIIKNLISSGSYSTNHFAGRRAFISQLALGAASIPFVAIIYGIIKGRYDYKIHRVNLSFEDLPEKFHGFTITQISDVHSGSFDNLEAVKKGVDLINQQKSDVILFTGDLVNNFAKEMEPWLEVFKTLKAPFGKFSVTGNHDYGDYAQWDSTNEKQKNFEYLKNIHQQLGFNLLLNENTYIEKDNHRIALLGMENWGTGSFSKYGDLEKTLRGIDTGDFKILMSHDPSHWDAQVLNHDTHHIHLTLAGHTHGMQFGVEIPGIKWSPVKYRYPRWAGLFTENKKHLYVNRGFGFIGFPGRVGIWPEVTVITLSNA